MRQTVPRREGPRKSAVFASVGCGLELVPLGEGVYAGLSTCLHRFCYACIENWSKVCTKCPLCKEEFDEIFKLKNEERIDGKKVQPKKMYDEDEEADSNEQVIIEGSKFKSYSADEVCYVCNQVGDTSTLLVCDHCNFKCCHTGCLDKPIDWIPEEDFYCKDCCEQFNLKNDFAPPQEFNTELYMELTQQNERQATPSRTRNGEYIPRRRRVIVPPSDSESDGSISEPPISMYQSQTAEERLKAKEERQRRLELRRKEAEEGHINNTQKYKPSPERKPKDGRGTWRRSLRDSNRLWPTMRHSENGSLRAERMKRPRPAKILEETYKQEDIEHEPHWHLFGADDITEHQSVNRLIELQTATYQPVEDEYQPSINEEDQEEGDEETSGADSNELIEEDDYVQEDSESSEEPDTQKKLLEHSREPEDYIRGEESQKLSSLRRLRKYRTKPSATKSDYPRANQAEYMLTALMGEGTQEEASSSEDSEEEEIEPEKEVWKSKEDSQSQEYENRVGLQNLNWRETTEEELSSEEMTQEVESSEEEILSLRSEGAPPARSMPSSPLSTFRKRRRPVLYDFDDNGKKIIIDPFDLMKSKVQAAKTKRTPVRALSKSKATEKAKRTGSTSVKSKKAITSKKVTKEPAPNKTVAKRGRPKSVLKKKPEPPRKSQSVKGLRTRQPSTVEKKKIIVQKAKELKRSALVSKKAGKVLDSTKNSKKGAKITPAKNVKKPAKPLYKVKKLNDRGSKRAPLRGIMEDEAKDNSFKNKTLEFVNVSCTSLLGKPDMKSQALKTPLKSILKSKRSVSKSPLKKASAKKQPKKSLRGKAQPKDEESEDSHSCEDCSEMFAYPPEDILMEERNEKFKIFNKKWKIGKKGVSLGPPQPVNQASFKAFNKYKGKDSPMSKYRQPWIFSNIDQDLKKSKKATKAEQKIKGPVSRASRSQSVKSVKLGKRVTSEKPAKFSKPAKVLKSAKKPSTLRSSQKKGSSRSRSVATRASRK